MTLTFTGLYLLAAMIQVGSLLKLANKLVNLLWSKGTVYILGQLQLNEYKTDPYFLQYFQSNTTVCLIIHVLYMFCP